MKATAEPANSSKGETGIRTYRWTEDGTDCLSVTSVRSLLGQPFNLVNWRINQVLDRVFDLDEFASQAAVSPDNLRRWLRDGDKRMTTERHTEAERGTAVHQAIELGLTPNQCTDEVKPYIEQYWAMKQAIGFDIVMQERQVWNLSAGYAGTLDALVRKHGDGAMVLVDWKTSKEVYLDYIMQAHAYLAAEFVGNDGVIDTVATDLLQNTRRGAIAKLSPTDWGWHEFDFDPEILRAWFGSLMFARYAYNTPDLAELLHSTKGRAA